MFRLLFHTYVKFGQTDSMELLSLKGREKFKEPYFLAIDLANYYQSRQSYDRASSKRAYDTCSASKSNICGMQQIEF